MAEDKAPEKTKDARKTLEDQIAIKDNRPVDGGLVKSSDDPSHPNNQ